MYKYIVQMKPIRVKLIILLSGYDEKVSGILIIRALKTMMQLMNAKAWDKDCRVGKSPPIYEAEAVIHLRLSFRRSEEHLSERKK